MKDFIIFTKNEDQFLPVKAKGTINQFSVVLKTDKDEVEFLSNTDLTPFVFGDCLFAYLEKPDQIIPIRRSQFYAHRNPIIGSQISSIREGLKNLNKKMGQSLDNFNQQIASNGSVDYSGILQKISEIDQNTIENEIAGILNTNISANANVNLMVSQQRFQKPLYANIQIKIGGKWSRIRGYIDTGSEISIIDSTLVSKIDVSKTDNIQIRGFTGGSIVVPYPELNFKVKNNTATAKFAVISDLYSKVSSKVLIGQDIYNYIKGDLK